MTEENILSNNSSPTHHRFITKKRRYIQKAYAATMLSRPALLRPFYLDELLTFCDTCEYYEPLFIVAKGIPALATGWIWAGALKRDFLSLEQYLKSYANDWEVWPRKPSEEEQRIYLASLLPNNTNPMP